MEIEWGVEDGFAGGDRPHSSEIDDADIEECGSLEEAMEMLDEYMQTEFEQAISWYYKDIDSVTSQVENILKNRTETDD
jgi:hypothetical protein